MKAHLLFILFLFFNSCLFSQIQVSDIEERDFSYETPIPITYNDSTYLILRRTEKTDIYGVDAKGLTFNHSFRSRPFSSRQSSLSIVDNELIEYYKSGFVRSNFTTAEVLDTVNFGNVLKFTHRGAKIADRYMVTFLWDASFKYYLHIYDLDLKESHINNVEESRFIINNNSLFFIDNRKEVYIYDLVNKQKELLYTYENEISSFGKFGDNIFISDTTKLVTVFDKNGIIETYDCFDGNNDISRLDLVNGFIYANITNLGSNMGDSLKCFDPETCELKYATGNFRVGQSSDYPENRVLLFSNSINYQRYKWLNLETFQAADWDEAANYAMGYGININEELYFTGSVAYEGYYSSKCLIYDTESSLTEELSIGNGEDYTSIRMSFDGDKIIHFIAFLAAINYQLWHYNTVDKVFSQSEVSDLKRNFGLERVGFNQLNTGTNRLFTIANTKFYITKDDQTTELVDGLFSNEMLYINNEIHILTKQSDSLFAVIINEKLELEYKFLTTQNVQRSLRRNVTNNTIFLRDNFHYNADLKAIDSIPVEQNSFILKVLSSSGNMALYYQWINSKAEFFLFDSKSRSVKPLESLNNQNIDIYNASDSRFLVVQKSDSIFQPREVFILDSLGNTSHREELFHKGPYYENYLNYEDGLLTFAYPGDNVTIFYMQKDDESKTVLVDNEFTIYYRDIVLYRVNEDLVMQVNKDGIPQFAHLSWDAEPEYFGDVDPFHTLKRCYTNDKFIINLIEDSDTGSIFINQYDKSTKELINSIELKSDISKATIGEGFTSLSDSTELLVINDTEHGNELYKLNLFSLELTLVYDLYEGPIGSDPRFIAEIDEDVFFLAYSEDYSTQLFKYDILGDTVMLANVVPHNKLVTYPNPGHGMIALNELLKSYIIFERNGEMVMENNSGGISLINISELTQGNYFIVGINVNGETVTTQFVKM